MQTFKYIDKVTEISVDHEACIGCRMCLVVCPHNVLEVQNKKAAVARRDECMECGACALNCAVNAISVTPGVGCASLIISRWLAKAGIQTRGCC